MCGIVGFISTKYSKEVLVNATNTLEHRGPDSEGIYFNEERGLGFGHRRLSIIDLSNAANQPMVSSSGRYMMVYNGEVYNYKELANELTISLKTSSDSEVILEAYEKWGVDFVRKLNGMFAIAIYDLMENTLHLFRDRLGIKPLYYYFNGEDFVFASEIKAIKQVKPDLTLNRKVISNYFHFGYIPNNDSIYQKIFQIPAGSFGKYNRNTFELKSYWNVEDQLKTETVHGLNETKKGLKKLIESSVEYRLVSDVPLGTFLSGGTDSSLVTAIASSISNQPVNTFSIGFKENKFNESDYALQVAKHLKTNHHEFIVSHTDALEILDKVMDNYDQPFSDSSAIPTFLVSQLAKKHATVALSGDGGDELFMGYGSYNWGNRLNNPVVWNTRKMIAFLLNLSQKERNKRAAKVFNCPNKNKLKHHIFSQEQYLFSEEEVQKLLVSGDPILFEETGSIERPLCFNEKQSLFDIKNYLKDDLLVKVDRASMLTGLEVRVPLLDHRIVEYALNIDQSLKINNQGVQKYILKEILYDLVPRKLLDHPKWGFSIPLNKWLSRELVHLIEEYLDEDFIQGTGIFNVQYVNQLKTRFLSGEGYLYNRIWQLIVFNKFLKNTSHF